MEKIQLAIDKARARRTGSGDDAPPSGDRHAPSRAGPQSRAAAPSGGTAAKARDRPEDRADAAWASIPAFEVDDRRMQRNRIVTVGKSREATEFDKLRTRLLQQMQANGWRRLAITSPTPASGKSTISLNLGFSLARRSTLRTVVCEVDLRRPSISRLLGTPPGLDFAKVLTDGAPFAEHAVRPRENLAVGVARGPLDRSAELFQDDRAAAAVDRIAADHGTDLMIFDLPPLLVSDDAIAFVDKVDCVLLIAAAGATTVAQIDTCERDLAERTNVLGVILNKCRHISQDDNYDYYG